jgi:hypothetical protein
LTPSTIKPARVRSSVAPIALIWHKIQQHNHFHARHTPAHHPNNQEINLYRLLAEKSGSEVERIADIQRAASKLPPVNDLITVDSTQFSGTGSTSGGV